MNRMLQYLNLLGIAALVVLCCAQWSANRRLNLQAIALEKTRIEQSATISEQEKTIKGYVADLDDFRQRLELSEAAFKEVEQKLTTITAERDQLKTDLDKWIAAVAQRDVALKQADNQIEKIIAERNDAISKFNDLANRYNAMAKSNGK
jgi:septal ring factor EnvC (AmiA/AmiB activator)